EEHLHKVRCSCAPSSWGEASRRVPCQNRGSFRVHTRPRTRKSAPKVSHALLQVPPEGKRDRSPIFDRAACILDRRGYQQNDQGRVIVCTQRTAKDCKNT